jgi:hypothetical protein
MIQAKEFTLQLSLGATLACLIAKHAQVSAGDQMALGGVG